MESQSWFRPSVMNLCDTFRTCPVMIVFHTVPLTKDLMYSSKHHEVAKCKHQCESTIGSNIDIQPRAPTNVSVMFINPLNEEKPANRN